MDDNTIRDQLEELLLDCAENAASPRETADYLAERGVRPPARVIADPAELDALPVESVAIAVQSRAVWQRIRGGWLNLSWLSSAELLHNYGAMLIVYTPEVPNV